MVEDESCDIENCDIENCNIENCNIENCNIENFVPSTPYEDRHPTPSKAGSRAVPVVPQGEAPTVIPQGAALSGSAVPAPTPATRSAP
jgi:hypothetical protein